VQLSHSVFMLRLEHIQFPLGLVVDLQWHNQEHENLGLNKWMEITLSTRTRNNFSVSRTTTTAYLSTNSLIPFEFSVLIWALYTGQVEA
jgi:hypothetical protein